MLFSTICPEPLLYATFLIPNLRIAFVQCRQGSESCSLPWGPMRTTRRVADFNLLRKLRSFYTLHTLRIPEENIHLRVERAGRSVMKRRTPSTVMVVPALKNTTVLTEEYGPVALTSRPSNVLPTHLNTTRHSLEHSSGGHISFLV